jgi:hypothetical protein
MNDQPKSLEALLYLDGRFNLLAPGEGFLIASALLVDVFETPEKAAAYYASRGGHLEPSHGGMHMLWRRPNVEVRG